MSLGTTIRRMFRRHNHTTRRTVRRWDRARLAVTNLEERTVPATITVTGNSDVVASDSVASLREAIQSINNAADANADITANIVGAYGTNDAIVFNGAYTISFGSQISISKAVTITGLGEGSTVLQNSAGAGANNRIFDIAVTGSNAAIKISSMTLQNGNLTTGNQGGAIRNDNEFLDISSVTFSNNTAVGNSTIGAGAAIAQTGAGGKLTITSSTFSGNSGGGQGGVIHAANSTTISITGSSFTGNKSSNTGGVINVASIGVNSSISMTNSTASSNIGSAGAVINMAAPSATITFSNDTITSNSTAGGGGVLNMVSSASTALNTVSITGGEFGSNSASTGGVMDLRATTTVTVNNASFTSNSASSSLGGGVFYTLSNPSNITDGNSTYTTNNTSGVGAVVSFGSPASSTFNSTGSLFDGNIAAGSGGGAINTDSPNSTITLNSAKFVGNTASGNTGRGGAIRINASTTTLTITNSILQGNAASGSATSSSGGALAVAAATASVTINGSTFSGNSANVSGGAITSDSAVLTINNSTFSGNTAAGNATSGTQGGGVIFSNSNSAITINNSTLVQNVAAGSTTTSAQGGAILRTSSSGLTTLISSIVAGNSAQIGQDARNSITAQAFLGGANLIGVADDGNITFKSTAGLNVSGNKTVPLNPQVGPLADNGGATLPHPFTHGLLPGSPAIGKGNQNGLPTDQTNKSRPGAGASVGATEVTLKGPSGAVASLSNVTTAGGASYSVVVVYTDENSIDTTTINGSDVQITSIGSATAAVINAIGGGGKSVTVTYNFTPPGGNWDIADNNTYTVSLQSSQVFDSDTPSANSVVGGTVGTFRVAIAQSYLVDNNGDTDDGIYTAGNLTLREAVIQANANNLGVADVINFANSLVGGNTITLGSELPITDPVFIQGNKTNAITIDGNNGFRIFNFNITGSSASFESTINDLTLTKGKPVSGNGGAILLAANTLTVNRVTISASTGASGGAVGVTSGVLNAFDSTFSSNSAGIGGGVVVGTTGQITLTRVNVSGNTSTGSAGNGGGIQIGLGSVSVIDSAITDNVSLANTTGTVTLNGGGGIAMTSAGVLNLINSTVAKNIAAGTSGHGAGILLQTGGFVTILNSTIANNTATTTGVGGGIAGSVTSTAVAPEILEIRSTIIAYNSAATATDVYSKSTNPAVFNAVITDSIIGVDGGTMLYTNGGGNQTNIDPLLSPLGFYGGGTKSLGLLPGSPALNKGSNPLSLANDQRGASFPRVVGGTADVGAFEGLVPTPTAIAILNPAVGGATTYTIDVVYSSTVGLNTTSFDKNDVIVTGGNYVGNATPTVNPSIAGSGMSVTVTYTFAAPGGTWGNEDNGTYTLTLQGNQVFDTNAVAALSGSLGTFAADIPTTYIVDDAGDTDDGLYGPTQLTLREAIKLSNVFASQDTITFATSINNQTISVGTEIAITQAVAIQGNVGGNIVLQGGGGRIFNANVTGGKAAISMSDLTLTGGNSTATTAGGAILNADEAITLTSMTITGNVASGGFAQGGAIASSGAGASVTINKSSVNGNQATGGGGAIYFSSAGSLTIDSSTFDSNQAGSGGSNGGGVVYSQSTLTLDIGNSTFTNNITSANWGGVVAIISGFDIKINSSKFESNITNGSGGGGAIYASTGLSAGSASITNSTFTLNSHSTLGGNGGAIYLSSISTTLTVNQSKFTNNTAGTGSGGAIYITGPSSDTITNSTFSNNAAKTFGGAIDFASTSNVTMDAVLVSNNIVDGSSAEGGGIYISGGSLEFRSGAIVNNSAISNGSFGGSGGGISTSSAAITILNSTLSGNYAFNADSGSNNPGGGAIAIRAAGSGGPLTIYNSTITNNTAANSLSGSATRGGAILLARTSGAVATIESSIIAGNSNGNGHPDLYFVDGSVTITGDNNIIGAVTSGTFGGVGNQTGTLSSPFNPGIFPLDTVTYSMPVHPLWYNSPALNSGKNTAYAFATDVRGAARENPVGFPDVGSFEGFADVSPFVVSVSGIVNITAASGSPYEIIVKYDGFKGVDSTTVDSSDLKLTLPGGSTIPLTLVSKTLMGNAVEAKYSFSPPGGTWDPTDNGSYTIDLLPSQVLDLDTLPKEVPAQTLGTFTSKIAGVFIVDNIGDTDDGNYSPTNLTLREAIKLSNFNEIDDDVIGFSLPANSTISLGSQLDVTDEVIINGSGSGNLTINGGGNRLFNFAILGAGGESKISSITLTGGGGAGGGAMSVNDDALTLTSVKFVNNSSSGAGGAISVGTTTLKISDSEFTGNNATGDGGAIKSTSTSGSSTVSISNTLFSGNIASGAGGAISMPTSTSGAKLIVADSTFIGNTANGNGGAISLTVGPLTMDRSIVRGNVSNSNASGGGGGALSSNTSIVTITDSEISDNQVTGSNAGGGAWRIGGSSSNITIINSTVSGNSAAGNGGAFIFNSATSPTFNLKNSTVSNNTAGSGLGGAIYTAGTSSSQPTINLTSSIVAKNSDSVTADIWSALDQSTAAFTLSVNAADSILSLNTHTKVVVTPSGTTLVGTTGSPIDAKLGALANNGGPTRTHALLTGSPAIDTGSNGDSLLTDQRGSTRESPSGKTDMGAYELQVVTAPTVLSVVISDGSGGAITHRSQVRQIIVTFSEPVNFSGSVASAFTVHRTGNSLLDGNPIGDVQLIATPASGPASVVTITFDTTDTTFVQSVLSGLGSLKDGLYNFTIDASKVSGAGGALDGDNNATPGGDYAVVGTIANQWFRLFGDSNGDGAVNQTDFNAFRLAFLNGPSTIFDFDGDNNVTQSDFNAFRLRFLGAP